MSLLFVALVLAASAQAQQWSVRTSGLDTNLRGISVVRSSSATRGPIVWACGSKGMVLRSRDHGKSWSRFHIPGGESLDFRGIVAFGDGTIYVMSVGSGEKSRIYKTTDAGGTWKLQYSGVQDAFFLDGLACISKTTCFALSDPVDGKFLLLSTTDGEHWSELPVAGMPPALAGEGAFAASNSALAIYNKREIYFATGGGGVSRVFHSPDLGRTWTVVEAPIASGNNSSGIFSIARTGHTVVVVGGDYKDVKNPSRAAAYSGDRGATWALAAKQPGGFRSAVAFTDTGAIVSVGTSGEDISLDGGKTWSPFGALNLNAVAVLGNEIWGAGPNGTIAVVSSPRKGRLP